MPINTGIGLMNLVSLGESVKKGYDDYEAWSKPYLPYSETKPISQMTLNEIRDKQKKGYFGAAGAFQAIGDTLDWYIRENKLSGKEKFNPAQQQHFFHWRIGANDDIKKYLQADEKNAGKYLKGAARGLSKIFASLPDPLTGKSYYDKNGKDKAGVALNDIYTQLQDYRKNYRLHTGLDAPQTAPNTTSIRLPDGTIINNIPLTELDTAEKRAALKQKLAKRFNIEMPQVQDLKKGVPEQKGGIPSEFANEKVPTEQDLRDLKMTYNIARENQQAASNYEKMDNTGAWAGKLAELEGSAIGSLGNLGKKLTGGSVVGEKIGRGVGHILNNAAYFIPGVGQAKLVADLAPAVAAAVGNWYYGGDKKPEWLQSYNVGAERGYKAGTTGSGLADMLLDIAGGGAGTVRGLTKAGRAMQSLNSTAGLGRKLEAVEPYLRNAPMHARIKEIKQGVEVAKQRKAALEAQRQTLQAQGANSATLAQIDKQIAQETQHLRNTEIAANEGVNTLIRNNLKEQKKTALNYGLSSLGSMGAGELAGLADDENSNFGLVGSVLGGVLAPRVAKKMYGKSNFWQDNFAPHYENSAAIDSIAKELPSDLIGRLQTYADDPSYSSYKVGAGADKASRRVVDELDATYANLADDGRAYQKGIDVQNALKADVAALRDNPMIFPNQPSGETFEYYRDKGNLKRIGKNAEKMWARMHRQENEDIRAEYNALLNDLDFQIAPEFERGTNNRIRLAGGDPATMSAIEKMPYQVDEFAQQVLIRNPRIAESPLMRSLVEAYQALWRHNLAGQGTKQQGTPIGSMFGYNEAKTHWKNILKGGKELSYTDTNGQRQSIAITPEVYKGAARELIEDFENKVLKGGNAISRAGLTQGNLATELRDWYRTKKEAQRWEEGGLTKGLAENELPIDNLYNRIKSGKITQEEIKTFITKLRQQNPVAAQELAKALWVKHLDPAIQGAEIGKQLDTQQLNKFAKTLGFETSTGSSTGFANTMNLVQLIDEAMGNNNPNSPLQADIRKRLNSIAANSEVPEMYYDSKNAINNNERAYAQAAITQSGSPIGIIANALKYMRGNANKRTGEAGKRVLSDPTKLRKNWVDVVGAVGNERRLADSIIAYLLGTMSGAHTISNPLDYKYDSEYNKQ